MKYSSIYSQHLANCLAHKRASINACGLNKLVVTIALRKISRERSQDNLDHNLTQTSTLLLPWFLQYLIGRKADGWRSRAAVLRVPFPDSLEIQRLSCPITSSKRTFVPWRVGTVPIAGGGLSTGREGGSRQEHWCVPETRCWESACGSVDTAAGPGLQVTIL
jgi:hypothetical protein